jgi:hypothetical protein
MFEEFHERASTYQLPDRGKSNEKFFGKGNWPGEVLLRFLDLATEPIGTLVAGKELASDSLG